MTVSSVSLHRRICIAVRFDAPTVSPGSGIEKALPMNAVAMTTIMRVASLA